jgi:hypothetical protein
MNANSNPPKVSVHTARLIDQLRENLKAEFGCDFSYSIIGRGHYIAASNASLGYLPPTIRSNTELTSH